MKARNGDIFKKKKFKTTSPEKNKEKRNKKRSPPEYKSFQMLPDETGIVIRRNCLMELT